MATWRDRIFTEFASRVAPLTLAADPDGLLLDEVIQEVLRERGFELLVFEDTVALRYVFELKHRARWDEGEYSDLVVLFPGDAGKMANLPWDLLAGGREVAFSLQAIFPNLSYLVLKELDRTHLDAVYDAQERHAREPLGDNATKDFVLLHVFGLVPQLLRNPSDLLQALVRRHYRRDRVPAILDQWFVEVLRNSGRFDAWPLETIVSDREAFLTFLQERWPGYVDRESRRVDPESRDAVIERAPTVPGPMDIPFEHEDVRVYVDNLFLEGLLHPIEHRSATRLRSTWASVGIRSNERKERRERQKRQLAKVSELLPGEEAQYDAWIHLAHAWAEASVSQYSEYGGLGPEASGLREEVDRGFAGWLSRRYAGLAGLPPSPPVMLHHVARHLARARLESEQGKVALIVVDGMSYPQWTVIRDAVLNVRKRSRFREDGVYAWVPTMTSVSRQAIFSGKLPLYFPTTLLSTNEDADGWHQFWQDEGLMSSEVVYLRGLGRDGVARVEEALAEPSMQAVGLVVDTVDRIMHGMQLGSSGMLSQVRQWAEQSFLVELVDLLSTRGFRIFLTSDHGNIEARGIGRPNEGATAEVRGERVRIFSDEGLRSTVQEEVPGAIPWPPIGLPENCLALLAPPGGAFVGSQERIVCHGGGSLEEVIVPFVELYWGQA